MQLSISPFLGYPISNSTSIGITRRRQCFVSASLEIFSSEDIVLDTLLGTYGYMNIFSYDSPMFGGESNTLSSLKGRSMTRLGGQEVDQGSVQTRLYTGRVRRGPFAGTRTLLKVYPTQTAGGPESDKMAANELNAHGVLQDTKSGGFCENLTVLLGGFESETGEKWLVFRNDGIRSVAEYCMAASVATEKGVSVGAWNFWDRLDRKGVMQNRERFIKKLLQGAFTGLSYMHSRGRLHQSLGPSSIVLNTIEENDEALLVPRLRDLAFAADVSDERLFKGTGRSSDNELGALSDNLWGRARFAGARTIFERKAFGIADDIYAGGLLLAYVVFTSLSKPGSIDAPSLQRLFETTFRLDLNAARAYLALDEKWEEAIKFLDSDDKAGWELLQTMMNPDYRCRPIAEAVACHRFLTT